MTLHYKTIFKGLWFAVLSATVSAQGTIQLKSGEKLALEKTLSGLQEVFP